MKVIVIGATGTIGSSVCNLLKEDYEIIEASRSSQLSIDLRVSQ